MSVHIKISYEHESELSEIISRLRQPGMRVQFAPQNGRFHRAYIKYNGTMLDKTERMQYNPIEQTFEGADIETEYPIK